MKPNFSIIIPTVGNLRGLRRLLSSLQTLNAIDTAEILIVQNPPKASTEVLVSEFPTLKIQLLQSEAGVNKARNTGLEAAQGKILLFLDDDCWISNSNFFEIHQTAHEKHPWAFAVGGFYHGNHDDPVTKAYDEIQRDWLLQNRLNSTGECQVLLGGHFSIKNGDLPLFDPTILYGGSETEYFFRLRKNGYRFLLIDLAIEHEPDMNWSSLRRKAILQGRTYRRLVKEGYHFEPIWQSPVKPTLAHKLYSFYFHQKSLKGSWGKPLRSVKGFVKKVHHDLWFYLSNQDSF